ncbi:unnamed protein product [Urochloa humidicola]
MEEFNSSAAATTLRASSAASRLLRLRCAVQHYEWGNRGGASLVARLSAEESDDPTRPYAELWMGTHPTAPSSLLVDASLLGDWLARNPDALGGPVGARWGGGLPFLFKVLSVSKALSIQAHPDKKLAEVLHARQPDTYKDNNHKPEMAIAITEFRLLCGFANSAELKDILRTTPEVNELVGHENYNMLKTYKEYDGDDKVKSCLRSAFSKLMTAIKDKVSEATKRLICRLKAESKVRTLTEKEHLVLSLNRQYKEDVGILAALFLNYVKLNPGEALYIDANEPHAYLSGECIECMATSDNVVRAGLTLKYRDVQTLCSMLTYKQTFPEIMRGIPLQPYVTRYIPPTDEFEVDCYLLPPGELVVISSIPGPSIFLVITGEGNIQINSRTDGENVKEGDVFFVPADTAVKLLGCSPGHMHLYRAGVNSKFFSRD